MSGPINPGGYIAYQTGTIAIPRSRTIPLETTVGLVSGDRYSIVVKLMTPGNYHSVAMEMPTGGYSNGSSVIAGQSYISSAGAS